MCCRPCRCCRVLKREHPNLWSAFFEVLHKLHSWNEPKGNRKRNRAMRHFGKNKHGDRSLSFSPSLFPSLFLSLFLSLSLSVSLSIFPSLFPCLCLSFRLALYAVFFCLCFSPSVFAGGTGDYYGLQITCTRTALNADFRFKTRKKRSEHSAGVVRSKSSCRKPEIALGQLGCINEQTTMMCKLRLFRRSI